MASKKGSKKASTSASSNRVPVLIEMRVQPGGAGLFAMEAARGLDVPGLTIDPEFTPIPMGTSPAGAAESTFATAEETYIVRGEIAESEMSTIENRPDVVRVWRDGKIAPFAARGGRGAVLDPPSEFVSPMAPTAVCPIPPCDCSPGTPRGTIADVATYLGVPQIWSAGFRGAGIVVGVVDGGITASGRPISGADTGSGGWPNKLIPRVIDGFPVANWGTTGVDWGWHGNMCSTDVLGMAPDAQLLDIRISGGGGAVSNALAGFQWAIDRHKVNGTPHILTNSWGIFQESWDPAYARDPNHPFTRKVVEALNEGIIVLFAAGNCGSNCPDGRCGPDNGPGRSIWGANGHPRVMTVGAVNRLEQFVGYSSQGPAALDPNKPDFCSITHFTGFFPSDSGTSAATPIAAGVAALLKQAKPAATHDTIKNCFKSTAKDIGPAGPDQHSGNGILQAKKAYDCLVGPVATKPGIDIITTPLNDILTRPDVDKPGTKPFLDLATKPYIDALTLPSLDSVGTKKFWDDVSSRKFTEDVKLPVLDHPPFGQGGLGGRQPFILSTPHHGYATGGESEDAVFETYAQVLEQCDAAAAQLLEQIENASAVLQALEQTYENLAAAFAQAGSAQP